MGTWLDEKALGHEGRPVALQRDPQWGIIDDGNYRQLGSLIDIQVGVRVDAVQAGCDCGWRGSRFPVLKEVKWNARAIELPQKLEEKLRAAWLNHVEDIYLADMSGAPAAQLRQAALDFVLKEGACAAPDEHGGECYLVGDIERIDDEWCTRCKILFKLGHGGAAELAADASAHRRAPAGFR